jgi:thiol-disulfide isomerase/thioredoxin
MSKKIVLALIVILLAGGGFYFYRQSQIKQNPTPEQSQSSVPAVESVASSSDRYQPYSSGVLAKTSGNRRVLYFYASWCPTCHPADADFVKNESDIPEDVRVIRINYNDEDTSEEETALAAQYKITYQHTFVQIDAQGNVITQWNGGQTADLIKNLK